MAIPDCPISLRTALVAFDRAFNRSSLGSAVRNTIVDIKSHLLEKQGNAYFVNTFDVRANSITGQNELFWPNYDRSVTKSLLRNAALKRKDRASLTERVLAEFELDMWRNTIEPTAMNLEEGEAMQYLAFKTDNSQDGASFQQISRRNGQLVLESQLLSLEQVSQIKALMEKFNELGEEISIKPEKSEVDPMMGWIVKGEAIDVKNDLPQMVDQVKRVSILEPVSEMIPTFEPQLFQALPTLELQSDVPMIASESFSFWFMATAGIQTIVDTPTRTDSEVAKIVEPTAVYKQIGKILVGREDSFLTTKEKPSRIITKVKLVQPTRSNLEASRASELEVAETPVPEFVAEQSAVRTVTSWVNSEAEVTVVEPVATETSLPKFAVEKVREISIITTTTAIIRKIEAKQLEQVKKTLKTPEIIPEDKPEGLKPHVMVKTREKQAEKKKYKLNTAGKTSSRVPEVVFQAAEPPVYELPAWPPPAVFFNDKEIPVWQFTFDDDNSAITLLIITTFFLIANTKQLRSDVVWGRGHSLVRTGFAES